MIQAAIVTGMPTNGVRTRHTRTNTAWSNYMDIDLDLAQPDSSSSGAILSARLRTAS